MSATVAAALKKIAVSLLTNPKILKTVLGIVAWDYHHYHHAHRGDCLYL